MVRAPALHLVYSVRMAISKLFPNLTIHFRCIFDNEGSIGVYNVIFMSLYRPYLSSFGTVALVKRGEWLQRHCKPRMSVSMAVLNTTTDNRYLFEFHLHRMTQLPSTEESPVKMMSGP